MCIWQWVFINVLIHWVMMFWFWNVWLTKTFFLLGLICLSWIITLQEEWVFIFRVLVYSNFVQPLITKCSTHAICTLPSAPRLIHTVQSTTGMKKHMPPMCCLGAKQTYHFSCSVMQHVTRARLSIKRWHAAVPAICLRLILHTVNIFRMAKGTCCSKWKL